METNNLLSENIFQGLLPIYQRVATVYQALPLWGWVGRDCNRDSLSQLCNGCSRRYSGNGELVDFWGW